MLHITVDHYSLSSSGNPRAGDNAKFITPTEFGNIQQIFTSIPLDLQPPIYPEYVFQTI